ncbi:MAG: hypothetical protein HRU15_15885, partial [Planctomycetes bacterium]|nr:hypothetical protein [Planctomycetota bacterium]
SESDDFSIDLGEVIDDSAATMVTGGGSDDAQITFSDSDGLEMPDLDDENTQEISSTGETSDLSFTESNTAVVTSVDETMIDETMVDATAADLQTVDYGDSDVGSSGRASGRVSQRSVRSQSVAAYEEAPVHAAWPALMALTMALMLFTIPYFFLALWPGDDHDLTGERVPGSDDAGILTNLASSIVGFSVEPDADKFKATHTNEKHIPVPKLKDAQANIWRNELWLADSDSKEARINSFIVDAVELVDGKPSQAVFVDGQTQRKLPITENKQDVPGGDPTDGVYTIDLP